MSTDELDQMFFQLASDHADPGYLVAIRSHIAYLTQELKEAEEDSQVLSNYHNNPDWLKHYTTRDWSFPEFVDHLIQDRDEQRARAEKAEQICKEYSESYDRILALRNDEKSDTAIRLGHPKLEPWCAADLVVAELHQLQSQLSSALAKQEEMRNALQQALITLQKGAASWGGNDFAIPIVEQALSTQQPIPEIKCSRCGQPCSTYHKDWTNDKKVCHTCYLKVIQQPTL